MLDFADKIKPNRKILAILLLIIIVGIFLRTYHFHSWLRFSEDQMRDTETVSDVISHQQAMPLLGPMAGTSKFFLGPIYYDFLYISGIIFGSQPESMAYPDLLFSILTIPLLYLLLKKYFTKNISLGLTALFSLSFFVVRYSRFAWNPNSTPFFAILFLYSLLQLADPKIERKKLWAILCGIANGVGIQLHAIFFFAIPAVLVVFFAYGLRKKFLNWKSFAIIIAVTLILNVQQIISEIKTGGENTKALFHAVGKKSGDEKKTYFDKIKQDVICHTQVNAEIISSYGYSNYCDSFKPDPIVYAHNTGKPEKPPTSRTPFYIAATICFIFSIGGYLLLFYYFWREKNRDKKNFLLLSLLLSVFAFVIFAPLVFTANARFFLLLEFMPFLLLGLWLKFFQERLNKYRALVVIILIGTFLAYQNLSSIQKSFQELSGQGTHEENNEESSTLGEQEFLSDFILQNSQDSRLAYIENGMGDIFKFFEPIQYFFRNNPNFKVEVYNKGTPMEINSSYFRVDFIGQEERRLKLSLPEVEKKKVLAKDSFGRYVIYKLEMDNN
jgi:hypothetical protein